MTLHERLDTRINVQNILTAIIILTPALVWANAVSSRVSALEEAKKAQEIVDQHQDVESNRRQDQINAQLKDLNTKLDRLIERRP